MLRIRNALNSKGISMKGCAEILGISEKSLYNKISGNTDFMYKEVQKLSSVLPEYNMEYLLSEDVSHTSI